MYFIQYSGFMLCNHAQIFKSNFERMWRITLAQKSQKTLNKVVSCSHYFLLVLSWSTNMNPIHDSNKETSQQRHKYSIPRLNADS